MTGPIKRLVDDADFLISGGRYEGALVQLLVAVAASSTKMFPAGTSSIDAPAVKPGRFKEMGDGEKFKRFLGTRIRKLLMPDPFEPEDGRHGFLIGFVEGMPHPEEVLYDQYRNAMIHEGKLPQGATFSPESIAGNAIGISFGATGVTFTTGLLTLLKRAVVEAPVNGVEFGLTHVRLKPMAGVDLNALTNAAASEFQTTPGRISVLLSILQEIGPACVNAPDATLRELFASAPGQRYAAGLRTDFYGPPICDRNGDLTDHGIAASRRVLESIEFIDIAT